MATVEGPYSRPSFHLQRSSSEHDFLPASERNPTALKYAADPHAQSYATHASSPYQSYNNYQQFSHMSSQGDYQPTPWDHSHQHEQHHLAPQHPLHQQAWQAALHGLTGASSPSFEGARSSTPLESQHAASRLRSSSGTSSSSNQAAATQSVTPASQPYHPYRRQPGNMKRSRSSDGDLTGVARSVNPVQSSGLSPGVISPSDTVVQTPNTTEQFLERPRVESNGSTDSRNSITEKGKIGVAVRAGRIPVPKLMNVTEGMQLAQEHGARSVSAPGPPPQPVVSNGVVHRSTSSNNFGNHHAGPAANINHKRQSSSTSSVGAVVRPTLGQGTPSNFIASGSSSTPPSLVVSSASSIPLAPVVSPERPTRTIDARALATPKDKSDNSANKGGLKGRLQRALNKTSDKDKTGNPAISSPIGEPRQGGLTASGSAPGGFQHSAAASGRSVSDPQQSQPLPQQASQSHPGLGNRRPSNSSFAPSFIEPLNGNAGKGKRNLFSMRNASTDNISIGSTVSSASMMIRKMGALGKLARRNRFVEFTCLLFHVFISAFVAIVLPGFQKYSRTRTTRMVLLCQNRRLETTLLPLIRRRKTRRRKRACLVDPKASLRIRRQISLRPKPTKQTGKQQRT